MAVLCDTSSPEPMIRVCQVAGRLLIFEPESAALIRRCHNISGTLIGTTPQQPTQNIFLGLPVELRPEEADILVQQGVACIVDIAAAHRAALTSFSTDKASRATYTECLSRRKLAAQQVLAERKARQAADVAGRLGRPGLPTSPAPAYRSTGDAGRALASGTQHESDPRQPDTHVFSLTLASSSHLLPKLVDFRPGQLGTTEGALCRSFNLGGYYTTPGLRFGAQYSVYPGDPLRFHAHFMANQSRWDDEISVLDVVSGGRLATAVKKAFLLGGQQPPPHIASVRTFSIEWAAM